MTVSLDFSSMRAQAPHLIDSIKLVLVWYAENRAAGTLAQAFQHLKHFLSTVKVPGKISSVELLNYRTALLREAEWYLGRLRGVLKRWYALNYPGVADDAITLLNQIRIKGSEKGKAVLTMDPEDGPYSDLEFEAIQTALYDAYSRNKIDIEELLLVVLFMSLGQRPVQYASLKVCDVIPPPKDASAPHYILRMPRAKQKTKLARTQFKERLLVPQIGRLLVRYADDCKKKFENKLAVSEDAPLFPERISLFEQPKRFRFHRTAYSLSTFLTTILDRLNISSERVVGALHITAMRFRRTVGTRAAREGHGELVIAELLDHSDTQNVGVYVQATPEMVERIDRAVAMHLAPLAKAFVGKVIADESQARRADDPESRIVDPRFDPSFKAIASCGKYGFCGFSAPIACYTCPSFEPWLDGPHELVLEYLLAERERLIKNADMRIASINDRTILAVAQVVRECQEIAGKSKEAI